jgi:CRISPR-associated protein Csb1
MFAKEQIKVSRLLTAHLEAFGAGRVGRSGVKFDRLGKTTSGQPIFAVDEETAREIRATFIIDLALLRSYGRNEHGLNRTQKRLLLDLAIWKIAQLLARPFRYRSGCQLKCESLVLSTEPGAVSKAQLPAVDMQASIRACNFPSDTIAHVYYPANELFKPAREEQEATTSTEEEVGEEESED